MKYKLFATDMNGVLLAQENFWIKLHQAFGTLEEGKRLTKQYLDSDYETLVKKVVDELWKGKDAEIYRRLVHSQDEISGVKDLFHYVHEQDMISAIISASSIDSARMLQRAYGVDHVYGNELVIRDGKVTGEFIATIAAGRDEKPQILRHLCEDHGISLSETIYVGDTDTDVEIARIAGLSIAFNSDSEELKEVCDYVVDEADLNNVVRLLRNH